MRPLDDLLEPPPAEGSVILVGDDDAELHTRLLPAFSVDDLRVDEKSVLIENRAFDAHAVLPLFTMQVSGVATIP